MKKKSKTQTAHEKLQNNLREIANMLPVAIGLDSLQKRLEQLGFRYDLVLNIHDLNGQTHSFKLETKEYF